MVRVIRSRMAGASGGLTAAILISVPGFGAPLGSEERLNESG